MDYENLLKRYRKQSIALDDDFLTKTNFNREDIKKILPHRDPFLLVDKITGLNLEKEIIRGTRFISKDDPIFKGHFPDFPVYPGSLQIEMTGQMGLCLSYFIFNKSETIGENNNPLNIRATRIIGAYFLEPLLPDTEAKLLVKKIEYDGFFGTVLGQVISGDKICSVSISEVCFLD